MADLFPLRAPKEHSRRRADIVSLFHPRVRVPLIDDRDGDHVHRNEFP
jgi:hypothetical protein